jgi:hypothetical protein
LDAGRGDGGVQKPKAARRCSGRRQRPSSQADSGFELAVAFRWAVWSGPGPESTGQDLDRAEGRRQSGCESNQ